MLEFGVFILAQQRGYHQTSAQVIKNSIEQTVAAEAAGFEAAWYAEHHFNNYSLSPSPLMMVAHCAALTKRIRLGTAVCILPLYHPLRLLAEIGLADTMSDGRLELGIGSGYQDFEFSRFGTNLADSHELFAEMYDILKLGLGGKLFSYDGKFNKIPPTAINVQCVQQPAPPIWVTSGHPPTWGKGIANGDNVFVTALLGGLDAIRNLRERLAGAAADVGHDIDKSRFGFLRCAYASDNQSEVDSYLDCARYQRRISESLKNRREHTDDSYLIKEVPSPTDMSFEQMRATLPVGSVNQVIDRMLEEYEILKPSQIMIQTQLGDFDQKTMLKQIELWGTRIIPEIRKAIGEKASVATSVPAMA